MNSNISYNVNNGLINEFPQQLVIGMKDGKLVTRPRNRFDGTPNSNLLVIGSSGSGKTEGVLTPNLLLGGTGSIVLSDPKGALYKRYAHLFEDSDYEVIQLDFCNFKSQNGYNPFLFLDKSDEEETVTACSEFARDIVNMTGKNQCGDPFWDESATNLIESAICYMVLRMPKELWSFETVSHLLISACSKEEGEFDKLMLIEYKTYGANSAPYRKYQIAKNSRSDKTVDCIKLVAVNYNEYLNCPAMNRFIKRPCINFESIGLKNTVVFVKTSDVHRHYDILTNMFFSQLSQSLFALADNQPNNRLPVDVRIMLDDFANTCYIPNFSEMINNSRSRAISYHIYLQSYSQLEGLYKRFAQSIVSACPTMLYLGGLDTSSSMFFSNFFNKSSNTLLSMPLHRTIARRMGEPDVINLKTIEVNDVLEKLKEYDVAIER